MQHRFAIFFEVFPFLFLFLCRFPTDQPTFLFLWLFGVFGIAVQKQKKYSAKNRSIAGAIV